MCGVVGVFGHPEAANLAYLGLYALQHRPLNPGWFGQVVRQRISNGAGWQSASVKHAFVQY